VGGSATLRLVLYSETSLRDDARAAREFLDSLVAKQAQATAMPSLLSEQHFPAIRSGRADCAGDAGDSGGGDG
jgi:menaquinone-specific isochorismate synthase